MATPALPAAGSKNWNPWAKWMHDQTANLVDGGPDFSRTFRKRVRYNLPFKSPDYAAAKALWGDYYPQAFTVDAVADELFVLSRNSATTTQVITVYVWGTGAYKRTFAFDAPSVTEGGVVKYENGSRFLYLQTSFPKLGKLDITTLPANLTKVTPAAEYATDTTPNMTYRNGFWTISDSVPPIGNYVSRSHFKRLNDNLEYVGAFSFEENLGGGNNSRYQDLIPKLQGIADGGNYFAISLGGYWGNGTPVTPYHYNGLRILSPQGDLIMDGIMHPSRMIPVLEAAGYHPSRTENEGVQVVGDRVFTMLVTSSYNGTYNTTEGLLFLEEFSSAADALDFTPAAVSMPVPRLSDREGIFPRTSGGLRNPITGATMNTVPLILEYMMGTNQSYFSWYTSSVAVTDAFGASFPTGHIVEIRNGNNSTFVMRQMGSDEVYYRLYVSAGQVNGWQQIAYTPRAAANLTPRADGTLSLGSTTERWKELHTRDGVVVNSPNGTRYRLGVTDAGALVVTPA